jgi:hypothetical protein
MAKPVKLPQWNTDLSNQTEPSAGQKTTGWTFKQKAISAYFNWLFYWIYQWIVWLDAGVWTAVSLALTGDLTAVNLVASANVTGASLHFTTEVLSDCFQSDAFDNTATIAIATHTRDLDQLIIAASATPIYWPMRGLVPGDVLTNVTFALRKNTNNTNTVTADIVYHNGSGETGSGAAFTDNSNALGLIIFAKTNYNITVVAGRRYYIKFTPGGGVAPAADRIDGVSFKKTHP